MEGEEQGEEEGTERGKKGTYTSVKVYAVMRMVKCFSDFTNTSWDKTWDKPLGEVLSVLSFSREWFKDLEKQQKKWSKRH